MKRTISARVGRGSVNHNTRKFHAKNTDPERSHLNITYCEENDRPQPALDRERDKGMATFVGRLREDVVYDYKFVGLSHNTLRGAAGGSVLNAELLVAEGYLVRK